MLGASGVEKQNKLKESHYGWLERHWWGWLGEMWTQITNHWIVGTIRPLRKW